MCDQHCSCAGPHDEYQQCNKTCVCYQCALKIEAAEQRVALYESATPMQAHYDVGFGNGVRSIRSKLDAAEARVASLEARNTELEKNHERLLIADGNIQNGLAAENAALRERVASYAGWIPAEKAVAENDATYAEVKAEYEEKLAVAEANLVASAEAQQRITDDATRLAEHMGKQMADYEEEAALSRAVVEAAMHLANRPAAMFEAMNKLGDACAALAAFRERGSK